MLATSRRGGRRIRKKKLVESDELGDETLPSQADTSRFSVNPAQSLEDWQTRQQRASSWVDESTSRTDPSQSVSRRSSVALEGHIASTDLLNPSDALDLLAQVADLDPSRQGKLGSSSADQRGQQNSTNAAVQYPPILDGALGYADANTLVQ